MLSSFRSLSKSKIGIGILAAFAIAILASFAMGDISSLRDGNFGLGTNTLAKTGGREVSDRDVTRAMDQLLDRVRQQNPTATTQTLATEYDPLVDTLVQAQALNAFGDDQGLVISDRLIGADIAMLPQTRGLDGKFSDAAYQGFLAKQRMTDGEVRRLVESSITQRLLLAPAVANARLTLGLTTPYAAMLMEQRQGEIAVIPVDAFAAGLKPSDADVAEFYAANKAHYTVPELRTLRIARFGAAEVAAAATPTAAEIAAYYNTNAASFGAKETRSLSQAVVPDEKVAAAIAARAKAGGSFAAAVQPAGLSAQDIAIGPQTRAQFTDLTSDGVATATFAAAIKAGMVVGPIKSDLGWHVVRIDSVTGNLGKSLAAATPEISAKLTADKRRAALSTLVNRIQDGIDGGQNFAELTAKNQLAASETPLLTATGVAPADPKFKLPPELAGALKSGFELAASDAPVVETLPSDAGFALVTLGKDVPPAPAPLDQIRPRVAADWVMQQASVRARTASDAIAAKVAGGMPLAEAMRTGGVALPAPKPITVRRLQLDQAPPALATSLKAMFTIAEGKSQLVAVPAARLFSIVKLVKITPGEAMTQPALIARVQSQFQQAAAQEYAQQFLASVVAKVGVKRNASAIAAVKQRLTAPASSAP